MSNLWPMSRDESPVAGVMGRAQTLIELGRLREALHLVDQALATLGDFAEGWRLKGEILRQEHRPREALAAFERALAIDPYDDWVLARVAEAYRDMGQLEAAIVYLDRALRANPDSLFALTVKGEILRSQGRYRAALDYLQRSLELNTHRAQSFARQAEELRQANHHEESLHYYDNALDAISHSAWVLASKGEALRQDGQLEAAHEAIDQALQLRHRHLTLLGNKAEMLRKVGHFEDALACYDRAKEIEQQRGRMLASKALILGDLDLLDEADALLAEALAIQPDEPHFWWLRGDLHDRIGDPAEARRCLARVIELKPEHTEAVATYARLLCEAGELAAAGEMAKQYLILRGETDDWGFFLLGIVRLLEGQEQLAWALLERALKTVEALEARQDESGDVARLLFNHALYSLATGDEQRARELYDHAIDVANGCYLREARADLHFLRRCGLMTQSIDSLLSHLERAA